MGGVLPPFFIYFKIYAKTRADMESVRVSIKFNFILFSKVFEGF